jgi:hypothetical protein
MLGGGNPREANVIRLASGLFLALLLTFPFSALALPETLHYQLSWLGIHIGTSTVTTKDSTPCLEIVTTIRSAAWAAPFFRVDDREVSCLHSTGTGFREGSYHKQLSEGKLRVDRRFTYNPDSGSLEQINHLTGEFTRIPFDGLSVDPVASTFLLRQRPLTVGDIVQFQIIDNDLPNPVEFRVLHRETITVPAGTFPSLVVESIPKLDSEGLFYVHGSLMLWLSVDPSHRPLRIDKRVPGLFAKGVPFWLRPLIPDNMLHSPKTETVRAELEEP